MQLQQSRSEVASSLEKLLHRKSVAVVLMTAGNELVPVFDSSTPAHACAVAKCFKAAQTAVKRPSGAVSATLKRMQWTVSEHDPFLWCTWTREESARTSCTTSSKKATWAWQWRRVALHEGYEGLDRGDVFAPLFAALHSPQ